MGYPDYLVHFNKNHDKKTGRFTFGDGNGDGVSPDSYRTKELDTKYDKLKGTGVLDFKGQWLMPEDDPNEKWGKDWTKAVDIGLEAIKFRYVWGNPALEINNNTRSWFMFEDQTYGLPEVAYLASKGWSKEAILQTLKDADEMETKNSEFFNAYTGYPNNKNYTKFSNEAYEKEPYDGVYMLTEAPTYMRSSYMDNEYEYIDRCIELAKEMKHADEYSEYLMHFNKNHDKKTGRFTYSPNSDITKKYTVEYVNSIPRYVPFNKSEENKDRFEKNTKIALQMTNDFRKARDEKGIGKNAKEYYKLEKQIADEANKRVAKEFKEAIKRGEEWVGDTYWDNLFITFDKIFDERGIDHEAGTIANLIDLGYSKADAETINKFINHVGLYINFPAPKEMN